MENCVLTLDGSDNWFKTHITLIIDEKDIKN